MVDHDNKNGYSNQGMSKMSQSIKKAIGRVVQRLLSTQNYMLVPGTKNRGTMSAAISEISRRGHVFKTVIDIGASDGRWSASAMAVFPECDYFLIEAQSVHEKRLEKFCKAHKNTSFVLAAAGERCGKIYFDVSDPLGGQASYSPYPSNNREVPVTTVDEEVHNRKLCSPFLIKFDTHGFEIPILKGAKETLKSTEVIIMECYNYKISEEGLLFYGMCSHMNEMGFRCIDLVEPLYRLYDNTFWQMDLVFVKNNRPEFNYSNYR